METAGTILTKVIVSTGNQVLEVLEYPTAPGFDKDIFDAMLRKVNAGATFIRESKNILGGN